MTRHGVHPDREAGLAAPGAEDFAALAARSDLPVLLAGETGTGKTFLARAIHRTSARGARPFVRVNCAAIPETLFERELFGHVRGAYTGADASEAGYLEAVDGGTLFLDEVGELPPAVQPKLLAVLEDGTYRRLGSPRERRVDVRLIAATHRDLAEMVRRGQFREDLFFRLSALRFRLSPLRERRAELPRIVGALLERLTAPSPPPVLAADVLTRLAGHPWPGNLRELENALRVALLYRRDDGLLRAEHLPIEVRAPAAAASESFRRYAAPGDPADEAQRIREVLRSTGGNRSEAARRLGMSRSTLWAKLHRYGVDFPPVGTPGRPSGDRHPLPEEDP